MSTTQDADRDHLHSLGYAQELNRGLGTFSNLDRKSTRLNSSYT